jgi:hypothetical protein
MLGLISGQVFVDTNSNSNLDAGESSCPSSVPVALYDDKDVLLAKTSANALCSYRFEDVNAETGKTYVIK